jgi:glycosyltransferase involved in cell wall biosynthesis
MDNNENLILYSVIIPHKNIPHLLRRCLDSIPKRDDVQIIVVDDNSDPSKVDFSNFPGVGELNTEVYFTKEAKGAGYARNFGLEKAKGKWLVFGDADDFFNESFEKMMDKYKESNADLIFFQSNSVDSESLEPIKSRGKIYNEWYIESINKGIIPDVVRYQIHPPWSKFFSKALIDQYNITFDEVLTANDAMFSVKSGHLAKIIVIDLNYLYCSTIRSGSLAMNNDINHFRPRYNVTLNLYKYLKKIGKVQYRPNIWVLILYFRRLDKSWIQHFLLPALSTIKPNHLVIDFFRYLNQRFINAREIKRK